MQSNVAMLKEDLRAQARKRRTVAYRTIGAQVAAKLGDYLPELQLPSHCIVAGYVQRGSELDPFPVLKSLHDSGYRLALPVVIEKNAPLVFRAWIPGDALGRDVAGLPAPSPMGGEIMPDVLFMPLVAFDGTGQRLGTGNGYYDRTLPLLRAKNLGLLAIGLAFSVQQECDLPHESTDAPLDAVVTERGVLWFRRHEI